MNIFVYILVHVSLYLATCMCVLQVISARLADIFSVLNLKLTCNNYDETGKSFWHFLNVLFLSCYIHLFSWQFLHWSSQEVWLTGLKPTTVMMIPASSPRVSQAQRSPSMVRWMFVICGIHYQEMFHQQSLMFIKTNMVME